MRQPRRYAPRSGQRNVEEQHALPPARERADGAVGPTDRTQQVPNGAAAVRSKTPASGTAGDLQPVEPDAVARAVVDLDLVDQVALLVGGEERRRGAITWAVGTSATATPSIRAAGTISPQTLVLPERRCRASFGGILACRGQACAWASAWSSVSWSPLRLQARHVSPRSPLSQICPSASPAKRRSSAATRA
jgi:hypothetical protein